MDFFPKKPASVPGIVLRLVLMALGSWLFAYLQMGGLMTTKAGLIAVLYLFTPLTLLVVAHQIWLRRRVARSQQTN